MNFKLMFLIYSLQLVSFVTAMTTGSWSQQQNVRALAAIKDPVVDLFLKPFLSITPIPASTSSSIKTSFCPRVHQGLFNEVVHINQIVDEKFVQISYDNVIYGFDIQTGKPLSSFWTTTDHLIFFKDLKPEQLDVFPTDDPQTRSTVILTKPFRGFSLGTRFTLIAERSTDYGPQFLVKYLDPKTLSITNMDIPSTNARIYEPLSKEESRRLFVHMIHTIIDDAHSKQGVIPYVWGGSSHCTVYPETFRLDPQAGWIRPHDQNPYSGFDCSELVYRIAQTCNIPYVWKNSKIAQNKLRVISEAEAILPGYLIIADGHVMIIMDVEKNIIGEARGYDSGFGEVHCANLSTTFLNIATFDQLRAAIRQLRPLPLRKKDGSQGSTLVNANIYDPFTCITT